MNQPVNAQKKLADIVDHDRKRPPVDLPVVSLDDWRRWRVFRRVLVARLRGPIRGPA